MSGMKTPYLFSIVTADHGLGMDVFKTRKELAEQAIRSCRWEMKAEERVTWLRDQADELEREIAADILEFEDNKPPTIAEIDMGWPL